ncbi:MAG: sporulation membrane protein YtaF [Firmicutes bacterium]|nr:sporulation membrane protein YtaF [Bacillota bacterium]
MQSTSALLALTVAVSLDGLAAGFSYGLKKLRLGRWSLVIVAASSGLLLTLFLAAGYAVSTWVPPEAGQWLGALLLMILGLLGLWEVFSRRLDEKHDLELGSPPAAVWQLRLEKLGLVIQILRDPQRADIDQSGNISPGEALVLGLALGLDAAGVGLGLGFSGLSSWWFPVLVAGVNLAFIVGGQLLGRWFQRWTYPGFLEYCPGLILIIVGLCMVI